MHEQTEKGGSGAHELTANMLAGLLRSPCARLASRRHSGSETPKANTFSHSSEKYLVKTIHKNKSLSKARLVAAATKLSGQSEEAK